jgi:hypothetical protein
VAKRDEERPIESGRGGSDDERDSNHAAPRGDSLPEAVIRCPGWEPSHTATGAQIRKMPGEHVDTRLCRADTLRFEFTPLAVSSPGSGENTRLCPGVSHS